jgi:hypothetical protein
VASGIVTLSGASKIYILQRVFYVRIFAGRCQLAI